MIKSTTSSNAIVLGGGTAGWLTAIFIKRNWPELNVTVLEDPKRPPIIAGESGTTTFVSLLRHLRIDINDFIKEVNATPKIGGKFKNWNGVGTEFIHALQTDHAPWLDGWTDYYDQETIPELSLGNLKNILVSEKNKDLYLKTILGNDIPLADAFLSTYFIKQNKVPFGAQSDIPCVPMWHFDSRDSAAYFKKLGMSRGITLLEAEYQDAVLNEQGCVESLILDNNRSVAGDWFFDCSGFARLLLGKKYKEPVLDYTNYFPARAVVAWWDNACYCPTTNATAMKYGWSWNINLRHRSGNGYIYDPDHLTLGQALDEVRQQYGSHIEPIANFQFVPGMMRNSWKNNVIAIGLSSGFLEPLEANGIAVIIESLYGLQDYWKPFEKTIRPEAVSRFNDRVWYITEDIRDFLALHYRGSRYDTEFWKSHRDDDFRIPESLKNKLHDWEMYYKNLGSEPDIHGYSSTAWLMVLQGLKVFDHSTFSTVYKQHLPKGEKILNMNIARYKDIVAPFLTIDQWVQQTA